MLAKGVVVAESHDDRGGGREMLSGQAFGDAGRTVVLEERLYGSEVSAHAICDGHARGRLLPFVQDHKRLPENDTGPTRGYGDLRPGRHCPVRSSPHTSSHHYRQGPRTGWRMPEPPSRARSSRT